MLMAAKKKPGAKKPSALAVKLRALRESLGLTQVQAAERAGVASSTWIAWENSTSLPSRLALRMVKETFPQLEI